MKTTFDQPNDLTPGRIAHVVYCVDGESASRTVTTVLDEKVSDAVCRELIRATGVPVAKAIVLATGSRYEYQFVDGKKLRVNIL
jgi:hypothetical protein